MAIVTRTLPLRTAKSDATDASPATIRDVAHHAGVSIATVSRAMNTPAQLEPATLARVRAAIDALAYRPSALGRMLRSETSRIVGVIVPTIANPVFGETLQGVDEEATQAGYRLMLMTTEYDTTREHNAIDTLLAHRVDGLILTVANALDNARLDTLDQARLPYVLAHNDADPASGRVCVAVDNFQAAYDGVTAMIRLGHRRIAMLSGTLAASDRAQQRHAGYIAAMQVAGLPPVAPIEAHFLPDILSMAALDALTVAPAPTALFCSNDRLAMVAIAALSTRELRVPADMSVMGFDGLAFGNLLAPALASVCVPNREIGRRAWHCLLDLMRNKGVAGKTPDTAEAMPRLPHHIRTGGTLRAWH